VWQEDVCTRCLYTICRGLSAQHLFGVSMVSIARHPNWGTQPPLGQIGPSIAPENRYVGETFFMSKQFSLNIIKPIVTGIDTENVNMANVKWYCIHLLSLRKRGRSVLRSILAGLDLNRARRHC